MADEGFAAPWVEFEKELGFRPLLHGPLENCFKDWGNLGGALVSKYTFPAPDAAVKSEDKQLPNNGPKIRIYTPEGYMAGSRPVCVFIHSGGWAMGDLDADDPNCRVIAKGAKVVVVSVDYRLAPQHKYPAGFDDSFAALEWAIKSATDIGGVNGKAFLAGASAGGGSALGLALKMIDLGRKDEIVGVVAQIPVTCDPSVVPEGLKARYTSYDECKEMTVNTASAMEAFRDAYGAPPKEKYVSVLLHDQIGQLPKTYITCAGRDTLRDDARLLKEVLDKNGVPNKYDEYPGYPHYFWSFPADALRKPREEYLRNLVNGVEFVLS
ncbi:alpha/beta-hydrolase [Aulographum hederae CBS 113979]|uniref:Alpha/beta-hydrolase n=1 Tax=Aulographum hederae CBS 113979 TaxID=1176131 RepID=A0A6G1HBH8_9PEZI|nr:alpha/beta-hydrolase [Aulographum hederae CBS 113979]